MACDPNTVLSQAACLICNFPADGAMLDAVELALLCAIRDGDSMACDVNSLMEQAKCLLCTIPSGAMQAARLSVLCQIATGGGTGGGGALSDGVADPMAAPTNPAVTNWYVNTATGTAWVWPAGGGAWQQIV